MNNELERIWKEMVMPIWRYYPEGTGENKTSNYNKINKIVRTFKKRCQQMCNTESIWYELTFKKRREETAKLKRWDSSLAGVTQTDLIPSDTITEDVGLEVLGVVTMKSISFWNVMPCSTFEIHWLSEESPASILRVEQ
jgi:hypothetical protein